MPQGPVFPVPRPLEAVSLLPNIARRVYQVCIPHLLCKKQKGLARNGMLSRRSHDKGEAGMHPWSMPIRNLNHFRDRQMVLGGGCRFTRTQEHLDHPHSQLRILHVSPFWQRTRQAQGLLTICHNLLPAFPFVTGPRTLGGRHFLIGYPHRQ